MLKKLHGENEKIVDEAALSDLETELSAATIPIGGGGAKKKQLNVNRYDLVSGRRVVQGGTHPLQLHVAYYYFPLVPTAASLPFVTAVAAESIGERGEGG